MRRGEIGRFVVFPEQILGDVRDSHRLHFVTASPCGDRDRREVRPIGEVADAALYAFDLFAGGGDLPLELDHVSHAGGLGLHQFIARDSKINARRWIVKIRRSAESLRLFPDAGSSVGEFPGHLERHESDPD